LARLLGLARAAWPFAEPGLARSEWPREDAGNEPGVGSRIRRILAPCRLRQQGAGEREGDGRLPTRGLAQAASEERPSQRVDDGGIEHSVESLAAVRGAHVVEALLEDRLEEQPQPVDALIVRARR